MNVFLVIFGVLVLVLLWKILQVLKNMARGILGLREDLNGDDQD